MKPFLQIYCIYSMFDGFIGWLGKIRSYSFVFYLIYKGQVMFEHLFMNGSEIISGYENQRRFEQYLFSAVATVTNSVHTVMWGGGTARLHYVFFC